MTALLKPAAAPPIQMKSPKKSGPEERHDAVVEGGEAEVHRDDPTTRRPPWTIKNSPSRLRFRPPLPVNLGFRLRPSGAASAYSRSVLGARGKLSALADVFKGAAKRVSCNLRRIPFEQDEFAARAVRFGKREVAGPGPKVHRAGGAFVHRFPMNFRLPPTALGSDFDLLALRARCTGEHKGLAQARARARRREIAAFCAQRNCPHFQRLCARPGDKPVDRRAPTDDERGRTALGERACAGRLFVDLT